MGRGFHNRKYGQAGLPAPEGLTARGKSPDRLNTCPIMHPNCRGIAVAQAVSPAHSGFHDFYHGLPRAIVIESRKMPACHRTIRLLLAAASLLTAQGIAWKDKPIAAWTAEDARQVLTDSPWAKTVTAGLARRQNEDERRDGGNMGQPEGVGFDGAGSRQARPTLDAKTIFHSAYSAPAAESLQVLVRWETALPVESAELKAGEIGPPTLDGEGYKIAVYGIPGPWFNGDPAKLGAPLKKGAVLKRKGKPDIRPSRVEVFATRAGPVVVYLFPAAAEISKDEASVEFDAEIGRVVIKQPFDLRDMTFQGKLEL